MPLAALWFGKRGLTWVTVNRIVKWIYGCFARSLPAPVSGGEQLARHREGAACHQLEQMTLPAPQSG